MECVLTESMIDLLLDNISLRRPERRGTQFTKKNQSSERCLAMLIGSLPLETFPPFLLSFFFFLGLFSLFSKRAKSNISVELVNTHVTAAILGLFYFLSYLNQSIHKLLFIKIGRGKKNCQGLFLHVHTIFRFVQILNQVVIYKHHVLHSS